MSVLVDSDVLIEVARARDTELLNRWLELSDSMILVLYSPVSVAELWHGAWAHEHEQLTALFGSMSCARIDAEIGQRAGEYVRKYRKIHAVALGDALIAASAALLGAALWTRNRKHYPMEDLSFY